MPSRPALLFLILSLVQAQVAPAAPIPWESFPSHRRIPLPQASAERSGFTLLHAAAAGILFTNRLSEERSLTNQVFLNGSGVALGDIDGDGLADLYFCGLDAPNALYRNLGNWRFEDITARAGVACADQASTGAAFADVDGDGSLDLLVAGIGRGVRLFLNDGRGNFREATDAAGLRSTAGTATLALADIDGDGWIDLYAVNYRNDTMRDLPGIEFTVGVTQGVRRLLTVNGRPADAEDLRGRYVFDQASGILENGQADVLYRNLGNGRFAAVPWTEGAFLDANGQPAEVPYDWGLAAMFRDLTGNGAPDLFVCNDFHSPDRLWLNDGSGRFHAADPSVLAQTSLFSMGVDFADLDRDGHDDFLVVDMLSRDHARRQVQVLDATSFAPSLARVAGPPQSSRNTLFRSRGDGTFAEIARLAGLAASEWSWSPVFLDVDLDGYEDLLVTTGHWRDAMNADVARDLDARQRQRPLPPREQLRLRRLFPRLDTPNLAFRNRGDLTFEDRSAEWGFDSRRISHGMALADLDLDGDLDVVINCLNDGPLLYRNESTRPRIAVRLLGRPPNTRAIGARVSIHIPGLPVQSQEIVAGGRYVSHDEGSRTFAAGPTRQPARIEVTWPGGERSTLDTAPPQYLYEIRQPPAPAPSNRTPVPSRPPPLFTDATDRLGHLHVDQPFDDFALQPLLPRRLSDLGPSLAWFDFNGDGRDDLLVGAGRGGRLGVFRNDGAGGFVPQRSRLFETPLDRDLNTVLGWRPHPAERALLLGHSHYETAEPVAPAVHHLSLTTGQLDTRLARSRSSAGPMTLGDPDGDGHLDLFVGGRVNRARYPEPADATYLRHDGTVFREDPEATRTFSRVGMVSDALFTDLDGNGRPLLVLACEWGAIRIFRWTEGAFREWNPRLVGNLGPFLPATLADLTGWWNSVASGDFDNDGRLDLVAGNLGRNTSRQPYLHQPIRLAHGELEPGGPLALLESHVDPLRHRHVPTRDLNALSRSFPALIPSFPTFAAFAEASASDLLLAGLPPMRHVEAATADSVLLLHRGDHFEIRPLPLEAQFAPVFGIGVGDFDGDGNLDLVLAQNLFGTSPAESRHDAGAGVLLQGDGQGGFTAQPPALSGIQVLGEGRGVAVADFDDDGRPDIAIAQHRGPTRLFRNTRGQPGLRVRLEGPPTNPEAIGATVRIRFADGRLGPVQERRVGGGYGSQDGSTLLLATPSTPDSLEIRWPLGRTESVPIPAGSTRLVVPWSTGR
ncbi:MAG: VCBS repeat-containing protein [Verrucomicrobiae bacterium]|nr:VCBS repeat-containing protein [Verrucomicrobiae bacterium]